MLLAGVVVLFAVAPFVELVLARLGHVFAQLEVLSAFAVLTVV